MEKSFRMRTGLIIGEHGLEKLKNAKVAVFGVGGVGSFTAEALARAGVGNLTLIDFDTVDITNINRQIPALHSTIGKAKVDIMKDRILDINPDINITIYKELYNSDTSEMLLDGEYDYVVDAIDMVTSKIHLIETCMKKNIRIICSMGMGNKLDPTKIEVADIHKTHTCPLAKVIRKELRDRNIKKLKVVYSTEQPYELKERIMNGRKITPGSISFVPSVSGLTLASVVVRELLEM